MEGLFGFGQDVQLALQWTKSVMLMFTKEPAVYFVAFAVVGAAAGVARKFVPMKRR